VNTQTVSIASDPRQEIPPLVQASDALLELPPDVVHQLTEVQQNIRVEGEFETKQARQLYKLGFSDEKALRHDRCGKYARLRKCEGAVEHTTKQVMKCGYRFTKCCEPALAKKQFEKYRNFCRFFERRFPHQRFTFLEIAKTIGRDGQSIRQFHAEVIGRIREVIECSDTDDELVNTPKMTFFRGFCGNVATVLALVFPDVAPETWKAAFPGATVKFHSVPMYRLSCLMEHELFQPWIPNDSRDRAEHEVIFRGLRRLRTWDMSPLVHDEDLSVEETIAHTDNSMDVDGPDRIRSSSGGRLGPNVCPECGSRIKSVSEYFPLTLSPADFDSLKWFDT